MEVVRKNFQEALPLICESIDKADFMAIDAEFTGLMNGRDVSMFDGPEEYYRRMLSGCSDFMLIQFGLCAFYWDAKKGHYMNDAYNFYLFPRGRPGPERIFLSQSSSLDFLAAQGFDFNKLIKEGISYMTMPIEMKLRESLTERQQRKDKDVINIPEENKQQIEDICKKVRQFINAGEADAMEIDRCNAFVRLLLFQELRARFKDEVIVESKLLENKNRVINVLRVKSEDDSKDHETLKKQKEWDEFEEAVGFSKVARLISQSEKLVIGHNMLLDVIHTLNHFFQPLPQDYTSFKEFAHCMFPKLLDTKYISSMPPFRDLVNSSVLADLHATLSEPPFIMPKLESLPGRGYTETCTKAHEAGFDAYVTGRCFLALLKWLQAGPGQKQAGPGQKQAGPGQKQAGPGQKQFGPAPKAGGAGAGERLQEGLEPLLAPLRPFLNKLYLAKTAYQDLPYMNLTGPDPSPSRDHVFHLTFPEEWQRNDINQLFSAFGPVTVQFMESTSAVVALARRDQAGGVARALAHNKRVKLLPYAKYKAAGTGGVNQMMARWSETSIPDKFKYIRTPESKARQVSDVVVARDGQGQRLPEKVSRARSYSASAVPAPAPLPPPPTRKRKSSGCSEDDAIENEVELKKKKAVRSQSEGSRRKPEVEPNRRRKTDSESSETKNRKAVIEKFDVEAKSTCVTAFKESENWD